MVIKVLGCRTLQEGNRVKEFMKNNSAVCVNKWFLSPSHKIVLQKNFYVKIVLFPCCGGLVFWYGVLDVSELMHQCMHMFLCSQVYLAKKGKIL